MITLILAAGNQARWNGDYQAPWPKQLAPIAGQPLLERTIAQLRAYPTEVVVVTHLPELSQTGERTFDPSPTNRHTAETLKSTQALWGARTAILLGDVVYSPWGLNRIMANPEPLAFFGRSDLRHRPLGRHYELFGLTFDIRAANMITQPVQLALDRVKLGAWPNARLREVYEIAASRPLGSFTHDDHLFYPINDWTEDLDTWEDYQAFEGVAVARGWCNACN